MAAYLDPAALRLVLGTQLNGGSVDYSGTAGQLSDAELASAISQAQAEVDGRLAALYTVPFGTPPQLVIDITADIAAYVATLAYRKGSPIAPGDPILLRYTRAQTLLTQAARGDLTFPEAPIGTTSGQPTVANAYEGDLWDLNDFALTQTPFGLDARRLPW